MNNLFLSLFSGTTITAETWKEDDENYYVKGVIESVTEEVQNGYSKIKKSVVALVSITEEDYDDVPAPENIGKPVPMPDFIDDDNDDDNDDDDDDNNYDNDLETEGFQDEPDEFDDNKKDTDLRLG